MVATKHRSAVPEHDPDSVPLTRPHKTLVWAVAIALALMIVACRHGGDNESSQLLTRGGAQQQRQLVDWGRATSWGPATADPWQQQQQRTSFSQTPQQQSFPVMQQQQQQSFGGTQQQQQSRFSNPGSWTQQQSFSWTPQQQQQRPRFPDPTPMSWAQPEQPRVPSEPFSTVSWAPPQRQEPLPQVTQPEGRIFPFISNFIPFFEPRQYSLHPVDAFESNLLCTNSARSGCNEFNTIRFTTAETPAANEFRYQNTGPLQMQGVFWTQQSTLEDVFEPDQDNFANSDLVSFARTRHGGGISTGALQTDANGYEYVMRPLGDHSWSTSSNSLDTHLSNLDILYLYDLTRGTLDNPLAFQISTNFKVLADCFRWNFGQLGGAFAKIEMELVTNPNNPYQLRYPGSAVWIRRTTYLSLFPTEYISVQVIDGNGLPIGPAWSEFQQTVARTIVPRLKTDRLQDRMAC